MDLSTEELLSRKETLRQFENYIDNTKNTLKCFVEKIGWTLDKTPINNELVKCPLDNKHRMPPSKLEDHCQKCKLKKNGYDSSHSIYPSYNLSTSLGQTIKIDEITQMRILKTAYEESNSTLNMIKECLVQDLLQYFIICYKKKTYINLEPREVSQSIERYVCDFTPDERRVLYDSAIKYTKLPNLKDVKNDLTGVDIFNKTDDKPKTEFELLQEQRDLKRRRAAYRGKRVHTDRKSYVEVLREVVEGLTNNLSHSEEKSVCAQTSNSVTETIPNTRIVYKYEGNRSCDGNPYTRWLNIETEESKLLTFLEKRVESSYQEASTSKTLSKDQTRIKKSRKSRSKSRERKMSHSELKYKRSRRSRSRSVCYESKSKKPKIRSKSKEYVSVESKHRRSRKRRTRSKSKESEFRRNRSRSLSLENTHKRLKKRRTRSKSYELEKFKCSRILTNYDELLNDVECRTRSKSKESEFRTIRSRSISLENTHKRFKKRRTRSKSFELEKLTNDDELLNEKYSTLQFKSSNTHKKKKKHKSKKKRSKSPRRSHKKKKNNTIEVCENIDDKDVSIIPSTSLDIN